MENILAISLLLLYHWLIKFGACKARVLAALRHQLFTSVDVLLPHCTHSYRIRNRAIGGLTGSRIAGSLARIPIESMLTCKAATWLQSGFLRKITVCSWIDNLLAFSSTTAGAIGMLMECEDYLKSEWGLALKESSKEYMPVWGNDDSVWEDESWRKVTVFIALGHRVEHTGSINTCFKVSVDNAWKPFWGNIGKPSFQSFSLSIKLLRLETLVLPIFFSYESMALDTMEVRASRQIPA